MALMVVAESLPVSAVRVDADACPARGADAMIARISVRADGEVAQLVEHTTENRSVGSSILPLATI